MVVYGDGTIGTRRDPRDASPCDATWRPATRDVFQRQRLRSLVGLLWQGRFASFVMEEPYLLAAARYVELNPVRAKLVARAEDWPWSRARAHLSGRGDSLVKVAPWLAMVHDWRAFLHSARPEGEVEELRKHIRTGRPLGDEAFLDRLEGLVERVLKPKKAGRPKKTENQ